MIDLNLAAMLEPATMLGTIPGVLLNVVFPAYLITVLLTLLLGLTGFATLRKGWVQHRQERLQTASSQSKTLGESSKLLHETVNGEESKLLHETSVQGSDKPAVNHNEVSCLLVSLLLSQRPP